MKRELTITTEPIDEAALTARRRMSPNMGAAIYFAGVVRNHEGNDTIDAIDYESFREMAEHQFHKIFDHVERNWPVESVRLVHRLGVVKVNEPSLWVEVVAPHRGEAFTACQYLIDEMKRLVPIWKKPLPKLQGQSVKTPKKRQGSRRVEAWASGLRVRSRGPKGK
ncbi:MAG: molybdenum cofactor biosynthesis protein MoaE [Verrucomicrobiota bacterium]